MNKNDRQILRKLAVEQMELASSPKMQKLIEEWYLHNDLKGTRPMVLFDRGGITNEIVDPMLTCESEDARGIEKQLIGNVLNHKFFGDDRVVDTHFSVLFEHRFVPFGIEEIKETTDGIGHHFVSQIFDLEDDFHKLKKSTYTLDSRENAQKKVDYLNDIFGDILPVKLTGKCAVSCLTQNLVHIMSMEDIYIAMMDYPELFSEMMKQLSDDYLEYFAEMEKKDLFLPTNRSEHIGQGMHCFTKSLPSEGE